MVAKARGYHFPTSKGFRGVTQVDPFSPTIFKVVMDAIVCHWVTVVAEEEAVTKGIGHSIHCLSKYFYDEDALIMSMRVGCLQRSFYDLADIFDHVRLKSNTHKTVSMVYQTLYSSDSMLTEVYTH